MLQQTTAMADYAMAIALKNKRTVPNLSDLKACVAFISGPELPGRCGRKVLHLIVLFPVACFDCSGVAFLLTGGKTLYCPYG